MDHACPLDARLAQHFAHAIDHRLGPCSDPANDLDLARVLALARQLDRVRPAEANDAHAVLLELFDRLEVHLERKVPRERNAPLDRTRLEKVAEKARQRARRMRFLAHRVLMAKLQHTCRR